MTAWTLSARPRQRCADGGLLSEMRTLLKLAIPIVLGFVSTVAMAAIDTAMLAPSAAKSSRQWVLPPVRLSSSTRS